MTALDSDPSTTIAGLEGVNPKADDEQLKEISSRTRISFTQAAKSQIQEGTLSALAPLLVIIRVTIIFAFALLADTFILMIINWSFGGIVSHNFFATKLLEGIQLLSALGTVVAYMIYLFRSLFKDTTEVLKETKETVENFRAKSD
jgi:hypothetical protein